MHPALAPYLMPQHGLVTSGQARAAGLVKRDIDQLLRSGDLVRVRRGVLADGAAWESAGEFRERPLLRVRAAHLMMTVPHDFSHDSAALMHGLPLPDARTSLVHVTRDDVDGDRCKAGVKHHCAHTVAEERGLIGDLPVLSRARTAVDLAREHGLVAGVAGCDAAMARGTTRAELVAVAERMASWPGIRTVRSAIDLADAGSESFLESWLRVIVHSLGRGRPETQFGLSLDGRTYFADLRVGRHLFEADGKVKLRAASRGGLALDPEQALWEEKRRQDFFSGLKLGVSRVTFADCLDERALLLRLDRELSDTETRFGASVADLAPYRVPRRPPSLVS